MSEIILARVQRCRYCRKEMKASSLGYAENPFCTSCLKRRIKRARPRGQVRWRGEGDYFIPEVARKRSSGGG
jgi:hypothetical protein